jgi:hypothetical protein
VSGALGRLPRDPDRPVLKLGRYLTGHAPAFPSTANYLLRVPEWSPYGNFQFGTCGPASVAHQRAQVAEYLTDHGFPPTDTDVFRLYQLLNPGFDPATGADDNGVVMADLLSALLKNGIAGQKPLAYAAVDPDSFEEVHAAIALFGSVLCGLDLDAAQDEQFATGQPWDYVRRSRAWGGHAVMAGAYTGMVERGQPDISVITWGQVQPCTDEFFARQLDEAWVVIWPELLGQRVFLDGVDLDALAYDYEALTDTPFPSLPAPPAPPPPPAPSEDDLFAADLAAFVERAQAWLDRQEGTR